MSNTLSIGQITDGLCARGYVVVTDARCHGIVAAFLLANQCHDWLLSIPPSVREGYSVVTRDGIMGGEEAANDWRRLLAIAP